MFEGDDEVLVVVLVSFGEDLVLSVVVSSLPAVELSSTSVFVFKVSKVFAREERKKGRYFLVACMMLPLFRRGNG